MHTPALVSCKSEGKREAYISLFIRLCGQTDAVQTRTHLSVGSLPKIQVCKVALLEFALTAGGKERCRLHDCPRCSRISSILGCASNANIAHTSASTRCHKSRGVSAASNAASQAASRLLQEKSNDSWLACSSLIVGSWCAPQQTRTHDQ